MKTVKTIAIAAAFLALTVSATEAAAPLRVCFDDHDAPRSMKDGGKGYDIEIMTLVAHKIGRTLEPVWIETEPGMTEVDDSDLPLEPLAKGKCDAVASVPGDMALQGLYDKLALTEPYYGAAFELVGPDSLPNDLASLKKIKISVQNVSLANLVIARLDYDWTAQTTAKAQLAALDSGEAQAALIWGPSLGEFGRKPKAGFTPPPIFRWNEHVATRKSDEALRKEIDGALAELVASGKVKDILVKYGVPPHGAFAKVFSPQDLTTIRLTRN